MSNDFSAPIKGEGMISDPDEYEWKCGCAKCEERYSHWKNDFDMQQAALREEGKWGASAVMNPDYVAAQKEKAQQALDVMAENARELGLDYEPVLKDNSNYRYDPPVAEPVAYLCENAVGHKYFRWKKPSSTYKPIALYTTPPAQPAPVQEPCCAVIVEVFGKDWRLDYMSLPVGKHKLYTQQYIYTTPPAQPAPVQEPVAWINAEKRTFEWNGPVLWNTPTVAVLNKIPLYTTPHAAQRQWVGLTDEEIDEWTPEIHSVIRAIEAKLKEKNT